MWKLKKARRRLQQREHNHQKVDKQTEYENKNEIDTGEYTGKVIQHHKHTYILVHELGVGAYAKVWMCYSVNKKDFFAIKIFKKKEKKSGTKELNIYEKFNKIGIRNTVKLYDSFEQAGKMCLVIDLMAGSLYDLIRNGGIEDGKDFTLGFDIDFVIKVIYNMLETLVSLHSNGIIHGDIKPENILIAGRTKMHTDCLKSIINKSSVKKMSETIKVMHKNFVLNKIEDSDNSDDSDEEESDDNDDATDDDNNDISSDMMSIPPVKITIMLSESESSEKDTEHNDEDINKNNTNNTLDETTKDNIIMDHLKLPHSCITSPIVKLSDMGSCVDMNTKKRPIGVQTKYYKSPEIILGLEYDTTCDIWALGCTAYEILTGEILFDPDDYDVDKKRCLLHHICAYLGKIPKELIDQSPFKQVFFTDDYTLKENSVYGDELYLENKWISLLNNMNSSVLNQQDITIKKYLLLDLILDMLKIDPKKRITASNALEHQLFKLCIKNDKQ